jgi:hypothetical protein
LQGVAVDCLVHGGRQRSRGNQSEVLSILQSLTASIGAKGRAGRYVFNISAAMPAAVLSIAALAFVRIIIAARRKITGW